MHKLSIIFCLLTLSACSQSEQSPRALSDQDELAQKGKAIYMAACIACHNSNPSIDGSLGPAVAGSSLELLKARVIEGGYPPGYTPKRPTKLMVALPQYEKDLPALFAFLNPIK